MEALAATLVNQPHNSPSKNFGLLKNFGPREFVGRGHCNCGGVKVALDLSARSLAPLDKVAHLLLGTVQPIDFVAVQAIKCPPAVVSVDRPERLATGAASDAAWLRLCVGSGILQQLVTLPPVSDLIYQ